MKNFWEQRPTINLEYCQCLDKVLAPLPSRQYSISWTIPKDYMGKSDCKPLEKTSLKAKFATYWVMIQTRDSGAVIAKNTLYQSKKVIIVQAKGKWNYSNFYTLKSSGWELRTNPFYALRSLRIKEK